jgi:hypothetical protein
VHRVECELPNSFLIMQNFNMCHTVHMCSAQVDALRTLHTSPFRRKYGATMSPNQAGMARRRLSLYDFSESNSRCRINVVYTIDIDTQVLHSRMPICFFYGL